MGEGEGGKEVAASPSLIDFGNCFSFYSGQQNTWKYEGASSAVVLPLQKNGGLPFLTFRSSSHQPSRNDVVDEHSRLLPIRDNAECGKEALELLSKVRMDAILLDLMMPEMDGFDVLRTIRENPELEEIPVFVVTAKDLTEAESRLLKPEVRALFRKDQSWKADLLAQLRKAVGKPALAKTVGQS
jgi:CheY-like chemotaxis protein